MSFLKYYEDIADLLFWVLWAHLDPSTKSNSTNLQETLIFIYRQKIILNPQFLSLILNFEDTLSGLRQLLTTEGPLKMMKMVKFYLKISFSYQDI